MLIVLRMRRLQFVHVCKSTTQILQHAASHCALIFLALAIKRCHRRRSRSILIAVQYDVVEIGNGSGTRNVFGYCTVGRTAVLDGLSMSPASGVHWMHASVTRTVLYRALGHEPARIAFWSALLFCNEFFYTSPTRGRRCAGPHNYSTAPRSHVLETKRTKQMLAGRRVAPRYA